MPRVYKNCVVCEAEFFVTEKSQEWLKSQGWDLPKRCFECREKKKARNGTPPSDRPRRDTERQWNNTWDDTVVEFFAPTEKPQRKDGRTRRRRRRDDYS